MSHATKAISNILTIVLLALGLSFVLASPRPLAAQERVMLILDSSGSMWGQVDGVNKHLIAREVIGNMLGEIGANVNMGVMVYGHRRKGDCKDIQTLIPVGPVDARKYMSRIERIQPRARRRYQQPFDAPPKSSNTPKRKPLSFWSAMASKPVAPTLARCRANWKAQH